MCDQYSNLAPSRTISEIRQQIVGWHDFVNFFSTLSHLLPSVGVTPFEFVQNFLRILVAESFARLRVKSLA